MRVTHHELALIAIEKHQESITRRLRRAVPRMGNADRKDLEQAVLVQLLISKRLPERRDVPRWISKAIRVAVADFYSESERNGIPVDAVELAS